MSIRPEFYHFGLIGFPVGHSLSPRLHQAALESTGLTGNYSLFPVAPLPEGESALIKRLDMVRIGQIHGLNVTIPHKQAVLPHMDRLTAPARASGAVNTVYVQDGRLVGDNTDIRGFQTDLAAWIKTNKQPRQVAMILGAGGSARAVAQALFEWDWQVIFAARRAEQAQTLVDTFQRNGAHFSAIPLTAPSLSIVLNSTCISALINTTPAGMHPDLDSCPWPDELVLPDCLVYDLVYNPSQTRLMARARQQGLITTNGLGMLVEQAAAAFEHWTGQSPDRNLMRQAASSAPMNGQASSFSPKIKETL